MCRPPRCRQRGHSTAAWHTIVDSNGVRWSRTVARLVQRACHVAGARERGATVAGKCGMCLYSSSKLQVRGGGLCVARSRSLDGVEV